MKILNFVESYGAGFLASAAGGFCVGYFGAKFHSVPPTTSGDWATWAGCVGTIIAVAVAGFSIYAQNQSALSLEKMRRHQDDAASLLALCYLGREIKQMCLLSGFQIDAPGNPILYPDISDDFASMAKMVGDLPIERVAARSVVGYSLDLRRAALHMSEIYKARPEQGDGFYFSNRNRIVVIEKRCAKLNQDLRAMLAAFDPGLYALHETELLRL